MLAKIAAAFFLIVLSIMLAGIVGVVIYAGMQRNCPTEQCQ